MAFDCLKIIGVRNECVDQTDIVYFLDEVGISLASASKTADERYVTGQRMIDSKVEQGIKDVIRDLTVATYPGCADAIEELICDTDLWLDRVAKAVYYKVAGLVFYDLAMNSSRYNDFIHYKAGGEGEALVQACTFDSQWLTTYNLIQQQDVQDQIGLYQKEMQTLEVLKKEISQICQRDCVGTRYEITLP